MGVIVPQGTFGNGGRHFFVVTTWCLFWCHRQVSSGRRPGVQPHILKCTQQLPTAMNYLPPPGSAQADNPGVEEALGRVSEHVGWGGGPKLRRSWKLEAGLQ